MTRLAEGRSTHLERQEIASETLRLFDAGHDPSIRQLAKELTVTPSAIYHHFESRSEIIQAAVEIVWQEILTRIFASIGDPFTADPMDVMVVSGLEVRRGFARHYTIAPYMAATPQSDEMSAATLAMMANVFERFGIKGEDAAEAFHSFASFVFGTSLFNASRMAANVELEVGDLETDRLEKVRSEQPAEVRDSSDPATRQALDSIVDLSVLDPELDEEMFVRSLRRLMESMRSAG